jgi:basic amino acid/polyamine antiporter, APA family
MIGWDLILEYAVGSMTVAVGWSGYFQRILAGFGVHLPAWMSAAPATGVEGALLNLPAMIIVLVITALLVVGVRESARVNAVMVAIKGFVVLFFIALGASWVEPANWTPFMPYGTSGVMAAAAVVFFAYIGFDAVSTTAEEARNPRRDLPIGIIASLVVCTLLYLAVAAVLSGIVPVTHYRISPEALPGLPTAEPAAVQQFLNAPVAYALTLIGQDWASFLVSAGAVAGITSVLLVLLLSQPRIFFAMSRDGLLPRAVSKVHPKYGTPYITTIITCVIVAIVAGVTQIQVVGEMTSIGTLFAFMVVCGAVLVLRTKRPDAHRPFRVAGGPVFPVLGIVSCLWLMLSLPVLTWVRFLVWLDIGMLVYWLYSRRHSPLADPADQMTRTGATAAGDFVTMIGLLGLFNGFFITLLAYMTEFGVTTEITAKWSEINLTPERADVFGWQILGVSLALFVIGEVVSRTAQPATSPNRRS